MRDRVTLATDGLSCRGCWCGPDDYLGCGAASPPPECRPSVMVHCRMCGCEMFAPSAPAVCDECREEADYRGGLDL